jgi:hypothetical protein
MDAQDYFRQLIRWSEKGYVVALETARGGGWTCRVSDTDPYTMPDPTISDTPRVRAISGVCETPEGAIAGLLKVVQP